MKGKALVQSTPALYFFKRKKTEEEISKMPSTYEDWVESVIELSYYEPMKVSFGNLRERYDAYKKSLLESNRILYTVEKFAATGEKSFIETFNKILEIYPDATLLGEEFQEWWEQHDK